MDPLTIDEGVSTLFELANQSLVQGAEYIEYSPTNPVCRWPLDLRGTLVENREEIPPTLLPAQEILEVKPDLISNIPVRDHTLVDQATCLAGYRPMLSGLSRGMSSEFNYANRQSKDILIYAPASDSPVTSPFDEYGDTYQDFDEWLNRIKNYAPPLA